jgi:hypothetical protein
MKKINLTVIAALIILSLAGLTPLGEKTVERNVPVSEKYLLCQKGEQLIKVPKIMLDEEVEKGEWVFESSTIVVQSPKNKKLLTIEGGCKLIDK